MDDAPPNAFEQEIDVMIAQLGSKSAAKRREAAYFLGEVATSDAVPALVEIYEQDKDASVRAAAAYALGMYKAVDQALARGEEKRVVELLRQIEEEGKIGKRADRGRAIRTILALVVSLVVLLGLSLFSVEIKGLIFGSTRTHSEVVGGVREAFNLVRNDTRTLQGELLNVISNRTLSCIAFFSNPPRYELDPVDARTYRDAAEIAAQINTARDSLAAAKARYDAACDHGAEFGAEQAQETFQLLLPALQTIDPIELELARAEAQDAATPPAETPIPPTATTAPAETVGTPDEPTGAAVSPEATQGLLLQGTIEFEPTIPPEIRAQANPKQHLPVLFSIIDDVTGPNGASTLLLQYWEDVERTGTTNGCDIATAPTIPNNDVFIPELDFRVSPDLERAVQLLNSGLASLRDGWVQFRFACNSRNLRDVVAANVQTARVTANAFDAASLLLDQVRNSDE